MSKPPHVSVIVPTYKDPKRVIEAVQSIIAQDYPSWEAIVIDDGSPRLIQEQVAKTLAELADSRVVFLRSKHNRGAARTRNLGIRLAQGRYLAFLDADDLWRPEKLSVQLTAMRNMGQGLSCTAYENVNEHTDVSTHRIPPALITYDALLKRNTMGCSTVMIDRQIVGRSYFPDIRMRQDFAHWLRILRPGLTALGLPQSLTIRRLYSGSLSSNKVRAAWYTWRVYRDVEGLNLLHSLSCMRNYAVSGLSNR